MTADQQYSADSGALALYGVSDELLGMFDALRETPSMLCDGYKYNQSDINALAQSVICRNYGTSCLRLSYLLSVVIANAQLAGSERPLLDFFWLQEAITPKRFRRAFTQPIDLSLGQVELGSRFLHIRHGKEQFDLSPTQVSYLAGLLELLVNIKPSILTEAEQQLAGFELKAIKSLASGLQKLLYDYLDPHLSSAQQMRRFRFISTWLKQQPLEQGLATGVNDAVVLDFWQQVALAEDEGLGFKRFRTVAENFIDYVRAVSIGTSKQAAMYFQSIGMDHENGQLNPEQLDQLLAVVDDDLDIEWLGATPKFLSKQQLLFLQPIVLAGSVLSTLPLTIYRMMVFGDWQAELVQALRSGKADVLADKLAKGPSDDLPGFCQQLSHIDDDITKVRLALLHIFAHLEQASFFAAANQLLPSEQSAWLKAIYAQLQNELSGEDPRADVDEVCALFFSRLAQLKLRQPEFNLQLQQASKAFKANNRQGFKQLPEVDQLAVYEQGNELLGQCSLIVSDYRAQLLQLFAASKEQGANLTADLAIYQSMFNKMY